MRYHGSIAESVDLLETKVTRSNRILFAALVSAVPSLIYGYPEGPDAGMAGVPGEWSCSQCHLGRFGSGSVTVNFPGGLNYTPGVPQHLVVTITDPVQRRWGFQLTARQANNSKAQAGSFTPSPEGYTQLVCTQTTLQTQAFGLSCPSSMPLQYIEHTLLGTRLGARSPVSFEFDWAPPATDVGNVVIYAAGNAANGDNTVMGDHIYYQRYTLSAAPPAPSNPLITGVVNAASSDPTIAAGSWVTITGSNLANNSRSLRADEIVNGVLPTQLDGVSVVIDGNPAYVSSISPTQITVQAPSDDSLGPVSVVVNNNSVTGDPFTVQLQGASPAFYVWPGRYSVATKANCGLIGPAGLFGGVTAMPSQLGGVITLWGMGFSSTDPSADCSVVCPVGLFEGVSAEPAAPGDVIVLWGTGFGPTDPPAPSGQETPNGQVESVVNPPSVVIGGVPAQVVSATLTPGQAGLYQIAVQVPEGLANGDQPVTMQINGVQSPEVVLINVQN
jgi:uncharacterized protein (TIGR03437 family)